MNKYYLIGEYFFESYMNSLRGEIELRERIDKIKLIFPKVKLRVIYGDDISEDMIVVSKE